MQSRVKNFFWTAYDHLGGLIVINLLWSALSLPWLGAGFLLVSLGASRSNWAFLTTVLLAVELVLVAPPAVLLFAAGARWARGESFQVRVLFAEVRRLAMRAQGLGLVVMVSTLLMLVNINFYLQFKGWLGLVLSGTMTWLLVAVLLMVGYIFPLLVAQELGLWRTLHQSFLVALDNLKLSFGLLLATLLTLLVGMVSGVGLFCGLLAALALLMSLCFRRLLPKYTGEPLPEEPVRRWRELIRPWEM